MISPSYEQFLEHLEHGNLIPVWEEVLVDYDTPVSVFRKIESPEYSFLLESVEGGDKWARYSFMGTEPSVVFRSKGRSIEIMRADGETEALTGDPILALRDLLSCYRPVSCEELPRFHGGAVGYFGYDMVRFIEDIPDTSPDELDLWDSIYMIMDTVLAFDNVTSKIKIISNAYVPDAENAKEEYEKSLAKIAELRGKLRSSLDETFTNGISEGASEEEFELESNFEPEQFKEAVLKTKEYIKSGDIIQAVISQRWKTDLRVDPFDLYRALRMLNPSPYMFFLRMGDEMLTGSSPEVMVRVEGERIASRPIAGTRPRGKTVSEDDDLAAELVADPKERAEHIMLVDLARNDLGRVSDTGSVKVEEFMVVERYSHVMHIVSNVTALLADGADAFDVIKATFPAGTLSGAPKVRAMEIIEEAEPATRGAYGGCVCYFSFSGNMDSCITIRTFVIKDGKVYIQAGAGIVADSNPETEYQETVNKVKALVKSVELAKDGI
ncbi:MAG: anthranilate synthase component I [Candidatus Dadabacteria bacterium]|nr:anthranilate synthase component I [Candidatus Dadabacteria bacterium]MYC40766.1 anthranilate synthase component I [Candidatus Dadabacteria bacterium]